MKVVGIRLNPVRIHGRPPSSEPSWDRRDAAVYGQGYQVELTFVDLEIPYPAAERPGATIGVAGSAALFVKTRCPEPDKEPECWVIESIYVIGLAEYGALSFTPLDEFEHEDFRQATRDRIQQELESTEWPSSFDPAMHRQFVSSH